ncbi:hypothetical protein GNI_158060 [Gregarina niphandrodes]|uniref:Uncharacterized protein n=1 Tax=Gregarina niphandrodes TaxID=110365 RepID=A0A023AYT7_GRENI|nr:hypothetical protein GNI_158060 [Gregarina niphandrodes]EZG43799.1 hypothetical protein GNI_158060 [Gregarina niphandrodes]|eukprot:XP_011133009.1 hypothetical protein GNI_158060 [Gregarina niphandrodes]
MCGIDSPKAGGSRATAASDAGGGEDAGNGANTEDGTAAGNGLDRAREGGKGKMEPRGKNGPMHSRKRKPSNWNIAPTAHSPACQTMLAILNYEAETSHLSVLDILIDLLRDLPFWIGSRSVVEKQTFLWSLYKLLVTDTYLLRKSCTWYYAVSADDPRINPIMRRNARPRRNVLSTVRLGPGLKPGQGSQAEGPQRSVIPLPDVRCFAFYQPPPEEEPLPEPIPKYNQVDLAEQRRHAEHVQRLQLATQRCQETRQRPFSAGAGTLVAGDYYLVPQADEQAGGVMDECLRFEFPFLETLHQDEKDKRQAPYGPSPGDQNWRYILAHLLKNNFSRPKG